jgi:hypothetical protein
MQGTAWHFPGGDEENHETPQNAGVPANIRIEHLPTISLACYRYTKDTNYHCNINNFYTN